MSFGLFEIQQNKVKVMRMFCFDKAKANALIGIITCLIVYLIIGLIIMGSVKAETSGSILITEALYNPDGSETGREAVELYNPTENHINISGWYLKTKSSEFDAVIPDGTIIRPKSFFLIADNGWSEHKDDDWPMADYEESITLTNTNSGVALLDSQGNIIDAVGWGDKNEIPEELFEGNPTEYVSEGNSISRLRLGSDFIDSNNNKDDFEETIVNLENSNSTLNSNIILSFNVVSSNEGLNITRIIIEDDDPDKDGNQIILNPGSNKSFVVKAVVNAEGNNNEEVINEEVIVECSIFKDGSMFKKKRMEYSDNNTFTTSFELPYNTDPGNYSLRITAVNDNEDITRTGWFEIMELLAIVVDTTNIEFGDIGLGEEKRIIGDYDITTSDKPTIKNIGNVRVSINLRTTGIREENVKNDFPLENLFYSFTQDFSVESDFLSNELNALLEPVEEVPLSIRIIVPEEQGLGSYSGSIMIEGERID